MGIISRAVDLVQDLVYLGSFKRRVKKRKPSSLCSEQLPDGTSDAAYDLTELISKNAEQDEVGSLPMPPEMMATRDAKAMVCPTQLIRCELRVRQLTIKPNGSPAVTGPDR